MEYQEFLERKRITVTDTGFDIDRGNINPILFGFQAVNIAPVQSLAES